MLSAWRIGFGSQKRIQRRASVEEPIEMHGEVVLRHGGVLIVMAFECPDCLELVIGQSILYYGVTRRAKETRLSRDPLRQVLGVLLV